METAAVDAVGGFPARVAEKIEHSIREGRFIPEDRLPSHRDLCRVYGVSLKTVRRALDILEDRGVLYRRQRSGTYVHPEALAPRRLNRSAPFACINFVEQEQPQARAAIRSDYLRGYTEILDHVDVKMRFAQWSEGIGRYETLLSDRFDPREQACVLANVAPSGLMRWLRERGIPFVVQFFRYYPTDGLPPHHRVYVNKVGAGFEATRYLLGLGHRRIGFAGMVEEDSPGLYDGYRAALLCEGLDHGPNDVLEFSTDDADLALGPVKEFLSRPALPTAVFARTDALAMAVLRMAPTLGLHVPRDLSVVGFNDLPAAAEADPPLTTMASPRRALARTAVEILLAHADTNEYVTRILNCHLVVRGSTAPPRGVER